MEEPFKKVVAQIFNNWTALKLAVEHSMGGPNSKQVAIDFMNYVVQFCLYETNVDVEGIQDALEDIMDEEFETVCEDESPKQIAQLLYNFLQLLKQGKNEECNLEFQKLPTINTEWLNQQTQQLSQAAKTQSDSSDESEAETTPMDQDEDGWTEVKTRKNR